MAKKAERFWDPGRAAGFNRSVRTIQLFPTRGQPGFGEGFIIFPKFVDSDFSRRNTQALF
jgi:hypothetical protein